MNKIQLKEMARQYANNGQHAEQKLRYTLTGTISKADNIPAEISADVLDIQIKSARATICKGNDLEKYLELDVAQRYAYVNATFTTAYVMSKQEWKAFCKEFATLDRESNKNGGAKKMRLGKESKKMVAWLERA